MVRTIILFLFIVSATMVAGCSAFLAPGNRLSPGVLEIPPDLTAPNTIGATRVPNITGAPMSAQTVSEFEQFQSREQLADYQEFLEWRKTHDDDEKLRREIRGEIRGEIRVFDRIKIRYPSRIRSHKNSIPTKNAIGIKL